MLRTSYLLQHATTMRLTMFGKVAPRNGEYPLNKISENNLLGDCVRESYVVKTNLLGNTSDLQIPWLTKLEQLLEEHESSARKT